MNNYNIFKQQLAEDITNTWGIKPHFGYIGFEEKTNYAVVTTSIERIPSIRRVEEVFSFTIRGFFKPVAGSSIEELLMDKAYQLIEVLAPFSTDITTPPTPTNYANVGFKNYVLSVEIEERENSNSFQVVTLVFQVRGEVYQ